MNSPAEMVSFTNAFAIASDGWAQLAPFGDHPGTALLRRPDGAFQTFPAVQRLDRAAAAGMVEKFKSPWQRLKRYFTGCPIYAGHPDVPAFAGEYPDKSSKGMIIDLQVRADGLYCKPVFTNEGSELVEGKKLRAFSGYWSADLVGEETIAGEPRKIYRPDTLKSAGLTNHPNLPVHLLNEAETANMECGTKKTLNAERRTPNAEPPHPQPLSPGGPAERVAPSACIRRSGFDVQRSMFPNLKSNPQPTNPTAIVNKQIIITHLAGQGITLANEATDDQIAAALDQLGQRLAAAETTLAARSVELESLGIELANERRFHQDTLLDRALAAGSITAAQRPDWAARLTADFGNTAAALAQLPPVLKTTSLTLNLGARKAEIANATDRRDALDSLVKAEMAVNGGDYDRAFATVQKANPALFSAMKQPAL